MAVFAIAEGSVAMASMNVSVPDPMRDWVQDRVDSGQYASVSDYVRDLIRRDQAQAGEKEALIAALIKGEESGISARSVPEIFAAVEREMRGEAK
jgi:antitoxin ParD1/3/4